MQVHEIMTAHPRTVAPGNTLVEAAGLMRELDVGALPVVERDGFIGIVTDRDVVVRGVADGLDPRTTPVSVVMSGGIEYVYADQPVEEAARQMENRKIRRLLVLDRAKSLVGMVSLGDIATSSNPAFTGLALRDVSEPREPSARQQRLARASEPAGTVAQSDPYEAIERRGAMRAKSPERRRGKPAPRSKSKRESPSRRTKSAGANKGRTGRRSPAKPAAGRSRRK